MKQLILKHALMQVFCDVTESLIKNWEVIEQQPDESAFFELLERNEAELYYDYEDYNQEQVISQVNGFIQAFNDFYADLP